MLFGSIFQHFTFLETSTYFYTLFTVKNTAVQDRLNIKWRHLILATLFVCVSATTNIVINAQHLWNALTVQHDRSERECAMTQNIHIVLNMPPHSASHVISNRFKRTKNEVLWKCDVHPWVLTLYYPTFPFWEHMLCFKLFNLWLLFLTVFVLRWNSMHALC